jgi:hypothetical protein
LAPSELLAARRQIVEFTGRQAELERLVEWRDEQVGWAVQLLHGPGGQGKSRLAARFAEVSAAAGWTVVTARHESTAVAAGAVDGRLPDGARGLLLVVDYAERWPLTHLLALLRDPLLQAEPGRAVRVLLLARPAGAWWQGLRGELRKLDGVVSSLRLGALAGGKPQRLVIFEQARDRFAQLLGVADAGRISPPMELGDPAFELVLAVHMAALVAVDAAGRSQDPPTDVVGLSSYLLDREQAYWQAMHSAGRLSTSPEMMGRVVFCATLTRPMPDAQAAAALGRIGLASTPETARTLIDDHVKCYPPQAAATVFEPLYPDRLGEDFLALQTPGHPHGDDYTPDAWAATAFELLLATAEEQPAEFQAPGLVVLIEAAKRWPHLVNGYLAPLLRQCPRLALAAGSAALTSLAGLDALDTTALAAVEAEFPPHRHVDLDPGIAAVADSLTRRRLASATDDADRARLWFGLGWRLAQAGRQDEALAATEEAVTLRRALAATNPAVFNPDLALSLNNLGNRLSKLGRHEEALAATEEAVTLYRALAAANPAASNPDLARAGDHPQQA